MSQQQNKRSLNNVFAPEKRGKVFTLTAIAAGLIGWGIYLANSGEQPNFEPPPMESKINETNLKIQQDKMGQTQLTNDARRMEAQLTSQRINQQIASGESKIFERKEELNAIAYKPKNTLEVVEVPKLEERQEVGEIKEVTPIKVEKENTTTATANANYTESYRSPSYAQLNRQAIDTLKTQMQGLQLQEQGIAQQIKFAPVEFTLLDEVVEQEKLKKEQAAQIQSAQTPVITTVQAQGQYFPPERVVGDQTAGTSGANSGLMFRAGERVAAITGLKASSLQQGPILVTLAEGQFAGAELMGTVSAGVDVLNFNFTSMWLPKEQVRVPISAIALSFDDQTVGTQTDVDNRVFRRFFLKPVLEGVAAAGQYYANDESSTVTTNSGVVVESKAEKTAKTARKVAFGSIAGEMATAVGDIDTTQIVTQDRNTPVVVMFMADVPYSSASQNATATPTSNVSQGQTALPTGNNAVVTTNTGVTNTGNIAVPRGAKTTIDTNSTISLTREEALALKDSKAATDPKVKDAINKALSQ